MCRLFTLQLLAYYYRQDALINLIHIFVFTKANMNCGPFAGTERGTGEHKIVDAQVGVGHTATCSQRERVDRSRC